MKVLLDGDMIAYRSAESAIFRLVTNDEVIVCQTDPKQAWINYNRQVEGIALALDVDPETDIWHCFTDRSMFRRELSPDYKANRKSPKPMGFSELKAKALELPWSFMHRAVEADDLIGIFATQLQAQLDAFKAEAEELHKLWADIDEDLASDNESVALSESGDQAAARRQRKAERAEARSAKRKKLGDKLRVVSKFVSG